MIKNLLLLFLLIIVPTAKAQENKDFERIYLKAYLDTSQKNFPEAIRIAESLYVYSSDKLLKTRSLMLSATLYQQKADYNEAVRYALLADHIIDDIDNVNWKARISGFLATQYRILKLHESSEQYIRKTITLSDQITDSLSARYIKGIMMQEKAYAEIDRKNYRSSINAVVLSQKLLAYVKKDKSFYIANNEQLLGINYYNLNDYSRALKHYQIALENIQNIPDSYLAGLIYNGMANVYLKLGNRLHAEKYFDKAKKIAETTEYLQLKDEIFETGQHISLANNEIEIMSNYKEKQDSVEEKLNDQNIKFYNRSIDKMTQTKKTEQKSGILKTTLLLILVCLILISLIYFIYYKKAQRIINVRLKTIISELKNRSISPTSTSETIIYDEVRLKNSESKLMSAASENKILHHLELLEESKLFLDNEFSLPTLASYCKTNTKYLSQVINNQKKMDFNNYINFLRINYIIGKLNNDPDYRKYKIATLAEEAGFSSQNKFATVFKKVSGTSPSIYIQLLQDQKR